MKLESRARSLSQGIQPDMSEAARKEATEDIKEPMPRVDTEGIVSVNDAIEKLNGIICHFSAMTDRLEVEKREVFKIAKNAEKQRIEADKLLYDLNQAIKAFPDIATNSIHAAVGATSHTLSGATEGLVSEVRQAVTKVFKMEVETLRQASVKATRSADALIEAKEYVGWQSIGINVLVVMLASFLLVKLVPSRIQQYEPTAVQQKYINNGQLFEAVWPNLSPRAQQEIREAAKSSK